MESSYLPVAQSTSNDRNVADCIGGGNDVLSLSTSGAPTSAHYQLTFLLHADNCQSNKNQSSGEVRSCSLPNCSTVKPVLSHMITCH
ncbi:hypothetical protein TNCT_477131 [Trichonephila clavata]|uniref:TAZ-type domain-containing protein n=1 Tax=Trichonephila clavata TaxID=2740835 RepID=A0A8X6IBH4_TRICU|nr:hypothetical protein TNCT_477131 [Trichonephila clavata]